MGGGQQHGQEHGLEMGSPELDPSFSVYLLGYLLELHMPHV